MNTKTWRHFVMKIENLSKIAFSTIAYDDRIRLQNRLVLLCGVQSFGPDGCRKRSAKATHGVNFTRASVVVPKVYRAVALIAR